MINFWEVYKELKSYINQITIFCTGNPPGCGCVDGGEAARRRPQEDRRRRVQKEARGAQGHSQTIYFFFIG